MGMKRKYNIDFNQLKYILPPDVINYIFSDFLKIAVINMILDEDINIIHNAIFIGSSSLQITRFNNLNWVHGKNIYKYDGRQIYDLFAKNYHLFRRFEWYFKLSKDNWLTINKLDIGNIVYIRMTNQSKYYIVHSIQDDFINFINYNNKGTIQLSFDNTNVLDYQVSMYFKVIQIDLDEPIQKIEKCYLKQASTITRHTPIIYFIDQDQKFLKYMVYKNNKPKFNKMEDINGMFHPIVFNT
jgi:hypothetical protein